MSERYDEHDYDEFEGTEEWQPGQCDNCPGTVPGPGAGFLETACACAIGQGANRENCICGTEEDQ